MSSHGVRLPSRFPIGTRYVIEGRGGGDGRLRVHVRYLEFPDGRHVDLPTDPAADRPRARRRRRNRRTRARK
jgi:hypothetical protein